MYHCFACGVGGDVIDFTARLFGISQYEAAKKLVEDFGLDIKVRNRSKYERTPRNRAPLKQKQAKVVTIREKLEQWLKQAPDVLMFGTGEEIVEFFKMKRREVERIEERINEYQREVLDGIRRYCERGNAYNRRCQ